MSEIEEINCEVIKKLRKVHKKEEVDDILKQYYETAKKNKEQLRREISNVEHRKYTLLKKKFHRCIVCSVELPDDCKTVKCDKCKTRR